MFRLTGMEGVKLREPVVIPDTSVRSEVGL